MAGPRVVILGGGSAGTWVANRLRRARGDLAVVVVDSHGNHLYQPGFLYLPFGRGTPEGLERDEKRLLDEGIDLLVERVVGIDVGRREVLFQSERRCGYDILVIATGSRVAPDEIPGFAEGAHHFHCRNHAMQLRGALEAWRGGRIVVGASRLPYKCPPSPHEFTFLLDGWLRQRGLRNATEIVFVYPEPRIFREEAAAFFELRFGQIDVHAKAPFRTAGINPVDRTVGSTEGERLPYDLLVLVPPHKGQPFLRETPLAGPDGWVRVDRETLRASPGVYALGDAADLPVPKSGAAAHFQAKVVVENILAELSALEPSAAYSGAVT